MLTISRNTLLAAIVGLAGAIFAGSSALAAQLLMLEQPGCSWCARFNAEIAPAWPNTSEGRRAPLRRVDITRPWPSDLAGIAIERFTPTFVLIDKGREIGRLRGYPGDEFFWTSIGEILAKLPKETAAAN